MAEPLPELHAALQQVAPEWDDARTARTLQAAQQKRVARRMRAQLLAGTAALCALCALGYVALREPGAQLADGAPAPSLELADGSRVYPGDANSQVVVQRVSSDLTEINLVRGRARFDVTHHPERRFRVLAGDVVVQVLGTAFEVVRSDTGAHVAVTRGRVAVSFPAGQVELAAGEARWFSSAFSSAPAEPPALQALKHARNARPNAAKPETSAPDDNAPISKPARGSSTQGWRQHAEQGDFTRAYALLADDRSHVSDDVEELLLAADTARLSGHAGEALPYLRKVSEKHAADPRAPLAAFTLGSVLMNQLGRPHEAQGAYARARTLAPNGSLAQDALARQVEAAYRAGDPARARVLALEYLDRYPKGRRVEAVRRFGGLP